MSAPCGHVGSVVADAAPSSPGCEDCLREGGRWVHLRMCRTCGHVGCCDSSPARHASGHAAATSHPLITSYEPGESWWWCYVDEVAFEMPDVPVYSHP